MKKKLAQNTSQTDATKRRRSLYKKKPDKIYFDGKVVDTLPGVKFVVKIERGNNLEPLMLTCQLLTMLKVKKVSIIKGDTVEVEIDPNDLTKGLIVTRL